MKKIFVILSALLLTGCGNELICTLEKQEEDYKTTQTITFEFDNNDKAQDATINYVMTFKDNDSASTYLSVFETLYKDYKIDLNENKINVSITKNYGQYDQNKDELKTKLESNGYICD